MRTTPAQVVLLQEHRLEGEAVIKAKIWARENGWSTFLAPASKSLVGGRSAGVGILTKTHIQAWIPEQLAECAGIVWKHRAIFVVVAAGGLGPILLCSAYLYTNQFAKVKCTPNNLRFLGALGEVVSTSQCPALVGGDWQMDGSVLERTGFLHKHHDLVWQGLSSPMGSCVTRTEASTIDYFICSNVLACAVHKIDYCNHTAPRPHRPVYLFFTQKPKVLKVCVMKEKPRMPVEPPFGPKVAITEWDPKVVDEIVDPIRKVVSQDARGCYLDTGLTKDVLSGNLEAAMTKWYTRIEVDLMDVLGVAKAANRGEVVSTMMVNLLNTFKCRGVGTVVVSKLYRWIQIRFAELSRALEAWGKARAYPFTFKCRTRVKDILAATLCKGQVKSPLNRFNLEQTRRTWHPKIQSVFSQVN